MSTSKKTPASIRQGGPGASHEMQRSRWKYQSRQPTPSAARAATFPAAEASLTATTVTTRGARAGIDHRHCLG